MLVIIDNSNEENVDNITMADDLSGKPIHNEQNNSLTFLRLENHDTCNSHFQKRWYLTQRFLD